eukprot:GEMP01051653.1.p1 GENE.GEMP01051653.1~~GEMP01051653.1.p1  ORF type:complete len:127 (+),score=27.70 GEMP01051653.1:185-565(+)
MADTQTLPKLKQPKFHQIKSIDPNTKRRNLIVKVIEVNPVEGKTFAEVVIGDESGLVTTRLQQDQLPMAKVGEFLRLQNVRVAMFQGHIRLEVDKWAKLAPHEKQDFTVDASMDVSKTEFELMTSK